MEAQISIDILLALAMSRLAASENEMWAFSKTHTESKRKSQARAGTKMCVFCVKKCKAVNHERRDSFSRETEHHTVQIATPFIFVGYQQRVFSHVLIKTKYKQFETRKSGTKYFSPVENNNTKRGKSRIK